MNSRKSDNPQNQRLKVFARCRPLDVALGDAAMMEVLPEENKLVLKDRKTLKEYIFDQVFSADSKQITVYEVVVAPLIKEVIMGYSCTVFAYGQTGTGKTYTMEGQAKCSWKDDPSAGIIPRSVDQLYEELRRGENLEFSVKVSFLEIYNEDIYDLLSSCDFTKLRLYEDCSLKDSVKVKGLEEILVESKDELYSLFEKGTARRHTAETKLNICSSRSHTVFTIMVNIIEKISDGTKVERFGKLNLVDLAGSENVKRSGADNKRACEAGNINQSLLSLGRVITALIDKHTHVPYRESKLTRILQYSLSGHAKTSFIATISPALCNLDETINTLEYASKAKHIGINPEMNRKIRRKEQLKELLSEVKSLRAEKEKLTKDLDAARNNQGFFIDSENYESMKRDISDKDEKIKALEEENRNLREEAVLAASDIEGLQAKIRRTQAVAYNNEDICDGLRMLSQKQCAELFAMVEVNSEERIEFSKCIKEHHDRLTHELSEHRKNTNCLREVLNNELQLFLRSTLQHLDEQTSSERKRENDLTQDLKSVKDSLASELNDFIDCDLPALLDSLNAEYASIEECFVNIHTSMKEKVNQHVQFLNNQTTEERKQLAKLKTVLESFFLSHDAAIIDYDNKIQCYKTLMWEKINDVSKNIAVMKEEMGKIEQFEHVSKFENNAFQLRSVQEPLEMWDKLIKTNEQEAVTFSDIFDKIKHQEKRKFDQSFCNRLTDTFNNLQKSQVDKFEEAFAKIESCNSEPLQDSQIKTGIENGIALISKKIDVESLDNKFAIQADVLARLGEVYAESEKSSSNSAAKLQGAILEKKSVMEKLLSEAFIKDISTGTTPQPRNKYSRTSSPSRHFSHSFQFKNRMEVHLEEEDESSCSDVSSFLNSQDISFASDGYDSNMCKHDSTIEPENLFDYTDNDCNKENELTRLSKGVTVQSSVPSAMNIEKQFKASPLSSCNNSNVEDVL